MDNNKQNIPRALNQGMRRRLQAESQRRTLEAAQQMLESEALDKATQNLAWVTQAQKILDTSKHQPSRLLLAASIALACLLLAGLALGINAPNNVLRLTAQTHSLSFAISQRGGDWQGSRLQLQGNGLTLENIAGLELRGVQHQEGPYNLDLYTADYYLSDVSVRAGTWVDVDYSQGILNLSFKRGSISGTVRIKKAELVLSNERDTLEQSIAEETGEVLHFHSADLGEVPMVLKIGQLKADHPLRLQATDLQFLRPDPPGSAHWVSTLLEGNLTLLLNGRQTHLLEGDQLLFEGFDSERLVISIEQAMLSISADGQADRIRAGPQGYEKDLAPTLLEYLYYQQQLTLFWSALIFLWGLFWSLRNLW